MFKFYFMYFPSKSGSIVLFVYLFICFFFLQGVLSVEVFFFDFHVDVVGLQGHRSSIMWHGSSATLFSPAEDFPEVAPSNGFVGYCGFRPYPKWWLDLTFRQDYPLLHWDALYEGMVAPHKAGYEYKIWPVSEAAGLSLSGPVAETAREVHPMNPELESALQNYRDFLRRFAIMGLWPS